MPLDTDPTDQLRALVVRRRRIRLARRTLWLAVVLASLILLAHAALAAP